MVQKIAEYKRYQNTSPYLNAARLVPSAIVLMRARSPSTMGGARPASSHQAQELVSLAKILPCAKVEGQSLQAVMLCERREMHAKPNPTRFVLRVSSVTPSPCR